MDQETLGRIRERLLKERSDLRRQLSDLGADPDAGSIEDIAVDRGFADAGQATAERDSLLSLVRNLRDALAGVEAALSRLDAGTYGVCEDCGQPIPDERLEALPTARLCLDCKQRAMA